MDFVQALEQAFANKQDHTIAQKQSAYMRNQFSFFGIPTPFRNTIQTVVFKDYRSLSEQELIPILKQLWLKEEREFQYAALDLALLHRKKLSPQALPLFEYMIRTKSWWDTVDHLASNLVGHLLKAHPPLIEVADTWVHDPYLWIRRSALLFQLKWKSATDTQRLFHYSKELAHEKEFFIRKAIGWALRQHSKTDPTAVASFISQHRGLLSPLSIKEASKYI
jgi:3-methyladenine DNA glycosylase AlkD